MIREISSLQHPLVKHLVKLRQEKAYRDEHETVLLEGSKAISEVSHAINKVFYLKNFPKDISHTVEEWIVTEAVLKKISGLNAPEGIVAEVQRPKNAELANSQHLLILDGLSDPGNMGTLLRTALAFGWDGVFIVEGSCDQYNEKVLRAARGAHFKLPIRTGSYQEILSILENHYSVFVADIEGDVLDKMIFNGKVALIMGNEARGPSSRLLQIAKQVTIPMVGEMESLNVAVAGGILLYFFRGQRV